MTVDYVFTSDDFLHAKVLDIEDIQKKIIDLKLSSSKILYINGGDNIIQMVFSDKLNNDDDDKLKSLVENYTDTDSVPMNDLICKVSDIKHSGTNAGSFIQDKWITRTLNSLEGYVSFVTLNNNYVTIQPGKYIITIKAPACNVESHQIRLRNMTSGEYILGSSAFSSNNQPSVSEIHEYLIISVESVFDIQHICSKTNNNVIGLGRATGFSVNEIYTIFFIQKL